MVDEGFDMAIRVGKPGDSSLIIRKPCVVRIVVVAAPEYLKSHGTPEASDDLGSHSCIIDTNIADSNKWPFRTATGQAKTVSVDGRIRFSNAEAGIRAAEAGLGLACVPGFVAGDVIRSGRVMRILQPFEPEPYDVYVLYPHSRHLSAKVRLLVDALVERFWGQPEREAGW
ncbi:substrate binding domain-containing protein [Aliiroseovarius sp. S1339]|nr:substrate binding domain-containing protein [Aliiroseovarius sp. S1339]